MAVFSLAIGSQQSPETGDFLHVLSMPLQKRLQVFKNIWFFLKFSKWYDFFDDQLPVETLALADDDFFHIDPVLRSAGECFQHNQVFSAAGANMSNSLNAP